MASTRPAMTVKEWRTVAWSAAGGLALLLDALAHAGEQAVDLAAVALDHRAELLLLRHAHADALDDHVDDLQPVRLLEHAPVDLDGLRAGLRLGHVGGDERAVAVGARARDLELLAFVLAEAVVVGLDDHVLEQLLEFLALRVVRGAPVAAEHEAADRRHVEAVDEHVVEARLAVGLRERRVGNDRDRLIAERLDELGRLAA